MRAFLSALAFLTTLPVPTSRLREEDFAAASRWFSLVGLVLGALLVVGDRLLQALLPVHVAAIALLALWVTLSGALHWDGLLDCFDALFPPLPTERRLEILKDVHAGAFAVVGGLLVALLYGALLVDLAGPQRGQALLLAPVAGRWAMSHAQRHWPYARQQGLGTFIRPAHLPLLGAWPLALALLAGPRSLLSLLLALLMAHLLAAWMARRLGGGLTGDCYGALCECTQLLVLAGHALG